MSEKSLAGRKALVTGGARGIGARVIWMPWSGDSFSTGAERAAGGWQSPARLPRLFYLRS